jgi:hypothetical protein
LVKFPIEKNYLNVFLFVLSSGKSKSCLNERISDMGIYIMYLFPRTISTYVFLTVVVMYICT